MVDEPGIRSQEFLRSGLRVLAHLIARQIDTRDPVDAHDLSESLDLAQHLPCVEPVLIESGRAPLQSAGSSQLGGG